MSIVRVETNFYGRALGSAYFGIECLNRICEPRGFTHWVILRHEWPARAISTHLATTGLRLLGY